MDRDAFHCLVLNAGCLAEQALVLALQQAAATEAPAAGLPPPAALDWSALDGLSLGRPEAAVPALPVDAADEAERAELSMLCALGPPDVYDAAAPFAARIDRLMARADLAHIGTLLAALPADAAPLTGRWCGRLAAGAAPLDDLVAALRGLDPPL
jgi:hypothetical protein